MMTFNSTLFEDSRLALGCFVFNQALRRLS